MTKELAIKEIRSYKLNKSMLKKPLRIWFGSYNDWSGDYTAKYVRSLTLMEVYNITLGELK